MFCSDRCKCINCKNQRPSQGGASPAHSPPTVKLTKSTNIGTPDLALPIRPTPNTPTRAQTRPTRTARKLAPQVLTEIGDKDEESECGGKVVGSAPSLFKVKKKSPVEMTTMFGSSSPGDGIPAAAAVKVCVCMHIKNNPVHCAQSVFWAFMFHLWLI